MKKIYLDICCFNRPYDNQKQLRIKLESEAKLFIQSLIVNKKLELIWSFALDFENSRNPYVAKQNAISDFAKHSNVFVFENEEILKNAEIIKQHNIKELDALHIACAIYTKSDYFITTDDRILKYNDSRIKIINPLDFIIIYEKEGDEKCE